MSVTVANIIQAAKRRYPDMPDALAVEFFNTVRGYVMSELQLRRTTITVNLVDGTQEYALNSQSFVINQVRYVRSATQNDFKVLRAVSIPEFDATAPDWRKVDGGEPSAFYIYNGTAGPMLGLDRPAPTTTTSSYPVLSVDVNQNNTLSAGDTVYDDLPNMKLYVYGIRKEFAEDYDNANVGAWDEMFARELNRAQKYLDKKNRGTATSMMPSYMHGRGGVI